MDLTTKLKKAKEDLTHKDILIQQQEDSIKETGYQLQGKINESDEQITLLAALDKEQNRNFRKPWTKPAIDLQASE